jgi:hypothetical protein
LEEQMEGRRRRNVEGQRPQAFYKSECLPRLSSAAPSAVDWHAFKNISWTKPSPDANFFFLTIADVA